MSLQRIRRESSFLQGPWTWVRALKLQWSFNAPAPRLWARGQASPGWPWPWPTDGSLAFGEEPERQRTAPDHRVTTRCWSLGT